MSSTNLAGATVPFLEDDPDDPDGNWATRIDKDDTLLHVGFPTPTGDPKQGVDLQEFGVLLRKDASGGNDPTYDIELWESGGGAPLATLVSGATLSSDTGEVVSATWDASLLGTADGSAVELKVVGHRSGGNPNLRRMVEVGAVEWNVEFEGSPPGGLYYLRARYYDPEIGRFLGQDPVPAANLYTYVGNNPVNLTDPSGLWVHEDTVDAIGDVGGSIVDIGGDTIDVAADVAGGIANYTSDKAQDAMLLAGHCASDIIPLRGSCGTDIVSFALSLGCDGDRNTGPGGWVYYENSKGPCEFMWWAFTDTAAYTPGYITFFRGEPNLRLRCHEYQHYIQSRLVPFPFYWPVALTVGERDATAAGDDKESRVPFTSIPWPAQCR